MYESTVISRYAFRLYGRYVYCWQILKSNVNPTLEHTRNTSHDLTKYCSPEMKEKALGFI
jgi:hypothetical protein